MRPGGRLDLARIVPSGRSIALGLALLAVAGGAWAGARLTSLFAVERISITGAPAAVEADVRRTLGSVGGESLLAVDLARLRVRVEALASVASVSFDRAFPHTLAVTVVPERPVAVLRQGARSWLASERGRVMRGLVRGARPALPRVWLGRGVSIHVGAALRGPAAAAVAAVAPLAGSALALDVASVQASAGELTLKLRGGVEVRLGNASDLPLKLAVASSVVPKLDAATPYLDVSIPRWPVAGPDLNSQVEVED
jgi:cell division septal protein FtsQ